MRQKIIKFSFWSLLWCSMMVFGQQKKVLTTIDTTKNKIGAPFNLTIKTTVDTASQVVFPKGKLFGNLEVIRSYAIDTIEKGAQYELIKKYGLTQFDSGKYTIPSLKVFINKKAFFTDSLQVEVANVVVDTLKQKMYDIKPIIEVPSDYSGYWWLLFVLVLIAGISYLIYYFIKKRQGKKEEVLVFKTPIEKATTLLKNLESKELWQKGEIKAYYSELTDIARNYIEEVIQIPAMESTTDELVLSLKKATQKKKMPLSQETLENLERVLKQADLVKFAKSKPLDYEIAEDKKKIERTIITIDQSIPEEKEEENEISKWEELKQLEHEKKLRKKRVYSAFGFAFGALFVLLIFLIVTKGFSFVKDSIIGHPSKELLEGEWVMSEYGNPGVIIETPAVLKRTDLSKSLPKEGMALIKEMQSFAYGSLVDDLYIMVSTVKYKSEVQIDLSKSIEGSLQAIEAQGAQNLLVKQEEFDTKQGIKGMKGYGTFSKINPVGRSSTQYYYEIIVFSQDGGLQQILFFHKEGDDYANQISERMLNSVELKKAQPNE